MFSYLVLGCNILAVLLGTAAGCLLRRHISDRLRENTMTYFAAISAALGLILTTFYLLSTYIAPYMTDAMIGNFSACGGLIQLVNALRIAKLKNPPVLDLIPGLILVVPITCFWPF